jgi:hypothetical protein
MQCSADRLVIFLKDEKFVKNKMSVSSPSIITQKVYHLDLGRFWEKNESLLKHLTYTDMPSKSRLFFKEISTEHDKRQDIDITRYDLVNIYDNRKNYLQISAEFAPDESIRKEEIVVGNTLTDGKKTTLSGSNITNKGHIEWLKDMHKNRSCQLFRT